MVEPRFNDPWPHVRVTQQAVIRAEECSTVVFSTPTVGEYSKNLAEFRVRV
jgi:hypothetical protein